MLFERTFEVEVNLVDFETKDIIEYLEELGHSVLDIGELTPLEIQARVLYAKRMGGVDVSDGIEDIFLSLNNRIV